MHMPIQSATGRDRFLQSSFPFFLSTIAHTAVFLVLAMCFITERVVPKSPFQVALARGSDDEQFLDLGGAANFSPPLSELGKSDEPGLTTQSVALNLAGLYPDSDFEQSVLESSRQVLRSSQTPDQPVRETGTTTATAIRQRLVHQVYASSSDSNLAKGAIRFGGKKSKGGRSIGFGPSNTLEVVVPGLDRYGSGVLSQASNLSLTGGAMMVSTAWPAPVLANVPLRFKYNASNEDGSRLEITAGNERSILSIYDWELLPLAKFVDSGHHGAVSIQMHGSHEKVSLDTAFEQTLLGLRFIQADLMSRGIVLSQDYLPQDEKGILLGPGELVKLSTDEVVAAAVRELKPLMARTPSAAQYSVLTDAKVRFVYSIKDGELTIAGTPYFFFWEPANQGDQVVPRKLLNEDLKKAWPTIKHANPVVIEAMEKCFRTVAFFRFQRQTSKENWIAFMQQVRTISLPSVPTPTVLTRE
jgi:hypothetical protein